MRPLAVLLLLFLASCARDEPVRPERLRAAAGFAGPEAEVVEVRVFEIPAGTTVERILLLGPDGERLEAAEFARSISESGPGFVARKGIGVAVSGGSSSGVQPSVSLNYGLTREPGVDRQTRRIVAAIPLADPAAYRAAAEDWRVEVHYSDVTGAPQVLSLPAPRIR